MKIIQLIENIRKDYLFIQHERELIGQLDINVNEETDSTFKQMWKARNQRFICDKLKHNRFRQTSFIVGLNDLGNVQFLEDFKKFGSNAGYISQLFQYLRNNPRAVSYLLFFAEKRHPKFLDILCKIIFSSIYSHCYTSHDNTAVVDMMEELLDIYTNFYKDIRYQIRLSHSSLYLIYRNYCSEILELKSFYKLALYEPIMQVLSQDNLFLDVDPNNAAMRFNDNERRKHFGIENTPEYQEKLILYKKWAINKLKSFVTKFISSLKKNIFAFPEKYATLIVKVYSKLVERFEINQVYSICIDLIFFFLLCPAIENPDLFGITDLHVNPIARYNLMQCSQIIQTLALSKWEEANSTYQEICGLFSKDCLSFVVDHILGIFYNISKPKLIESNNVPYFLISEFELKLLLSYIQLFLNENHQSDSPMKTQFDKIPASVLNFELVLKCSNNAEPLKKSKSTDSGLNLTENINYDIDRIIASDNEEFILYLKYLFNSPNVYQITNNDDKRQMFELLNEQKILNKIKPEHFSHAEIMQVLFENAEDMLNSEIAHLDDKCNIVNQSNDNIANFKNDFVHSIFDEISNNSIESDNDNLFVKPDLMTDNNISWNNLSDDRLTNYVNMQSLGHLSLNLNDMNEVNVNLCNLSIIKEDKSDTDSVDLPLQQSVQQKFDELIGQSSDPCLTGHTLTDKIDLNQENVCDSNLFVANFNDQFPNNMDNLDVNNSQKSILVKKSSFFSLNFKNIKDKVKNISLKDPRSHPSMIDYYNSPEGESENNLTSDSCKEKSVSDVKEKTSEILDKYRPKNTNDQIEMNANCQVDGSDQQDDIDSMKTTQLVDYHADLKLKLRKLMCLVNLSSIYESYRFLNIENKTNFIMLLKIVLSQSQNMDNITNVVLLMDVIRIMENLNETDFVNIFIDLENDLKKRNIFTVYLIKCRKYLHFKLERVKSSQKLIAKEQFITNFMIVSFLIQQLTEKNERYIQECVGKLCDLTLMADEKVEVIKDLIQGICDSAEFRILDWDQYLLGKQIIERHLMSMMYLYAFYPNGDIDIMRDQLLHQQISTLSSIVSHSSNLLRIPSKYLTTSPWPSAQAELLLLSAYKTPRDKVQCVMRCCSHIMTLLNTCENTIPSADDLLPVLIFVVIKANPFSLLSTIQYVNSFYSKDKKNTLDTELSGEKSYYWTQFCSAVEHIKTILNEQQ